MKACAVVAALLLLRLSVCRSLLSRPRWTWSARTALPPCHSNRPTLYDPSTDEFFPYIDEASLASSAWKSKLIALTLEEAEETVDLASIPVKSVRKNSKTKPATLATTALTMEWLSRLFKGDKLVAIENTLRSSMDSGVVFITETELQRLWREQSAQPMGKSLSSFTIEQALLLIEDEEDRMLMGRTDEPAETLMLPAASSIKKKANAAALAKVEKPSKRKTKGADVELSLKAAVAVADDAVKFDDEEEVIIDEEEVYVTAQELRRLWDRRAQIAWGLPAPEFDEKLALMLVEDSFPEEDDPEYGGYEYIEAYRDDSVDITDSNGFWNAYPQRKVRELLRNIYRKLETVVDDMEAPPGKYLGITAEGLYTVENFYTSEVKVPFRIPAAWNDAEEENLSEAYQLATSMTYPDEKKTDYNKRTPLWERLNLPLYPDYPHDLSLDPVLESTLPENQPKRELSRYEDDDDDAMSAALLMSDKDARQFYERPGFNQKPLSFGDRVTRFRTSLSPEMLSVYGDDIPAIIAKQNNNELNHSAHRAIVEQYFERSQRPWTTPKEWLERDEWRFHVGSDVWMNYDADEFDDGDNEIWEEDVAMMETVRHVLNITSLYLVDHNANRRKVDAHRSLERYVNAVLRNATYVGRGKSRRLTHSVEYPVKEKIPRYLTPDIDQGVEYSMEIIEMKGGKSLLPKVPRPRDAWGNESFDTPEDLDYKSANQIGTVREQYDWKPRKDLEHVIEPQKLPKLAPLLYFVNAAAELQSTKDNILIFKYKSAMRHLIGIRAMMLHIAKDCFPEVVDIRLETERNADHQDIRSY